MKYPCNVIRDLMPSYIDGLCSEESKDIVKEHINECPKCKELFNDYSSDFENSSISTVFSDEKEIIKKVNQKNKRTSLLNSFVTVIAAIIIMIILVVVIAPNRNLKKDEYQITFDNYYMPDHVLIIDDSWEVSPPKDKEQIIYVTSEDKNEQPSLDGDSQMVHINGFFAVVDNEYMDENPYACVVTITSDYPIASSDIIPVIGDNGEVIIEVKNVKSPLFGNKSIEGQTSAKYIFFCKADNIGE